VACALQGAMPLAAPAVGHGSATRGSSDSAQPDPGLLALPVRPAAKPPRTASPPARRQEDNEAPSPITSSPSSATEQPSAAASKVVPQFYGDFAPASGSATRATPESSEAPPGEPARSEAKLPLAPESPPPPAAATSLLDYTRTAQILRRLIPTARSFPTDYRIRPTQCDVPLTLRGSGWNGRNLPIGGEDAYRDRIPPNYMPTDLVLIPAEYCYANQPLYLRREAAESVVRMIRDAERQGLTLRVVSAYRDSQHQQRLYAQNGGGRGRRTVARPGKSEHLLGTTVDFTSTERYLLRPSFANTPEGRWLARNAPRYGWYLTVVSGSRVIEPWHFRYFGRNATAAATPGAGKTPSPVSAIKKAENVITSPFRAAGSMAKKLLGR